MSNKITKMEENEFESIIRSAEIKDIENESVYVCGYTECRVTYDGDGEEHMTEDRCTFCCVTPSDENFEDVQHNTYLILLERLVTEWDYDEIVVDKRNCFVRKTCESEYAEYYDFFTSSEIPKELVKKIFAKNSN